MAVRPSPVIAAVVRRVGAAWAARDFVCYANQISDIPHFRAVGTDADEFWESATVADVAAVPDEALLPGNNNGSVLMWAAMSTADPDVVSALIERGANVNESDPVFSGPPLSAAAGYSRHPEIIERLVEHGADVNKTVNNGETPLHIAARYNTHPEIIHALI